MPGRVFLTTCPSDLAAMFGVPADPIENEPPRHNIAPGQDVVVLTVNGLAKMRWGMIPVGRVNARGRPVMETIINTRSETVLDKSAFAGVGRAVMPVNGWYEWTGKARRKTAWRIASKEAGLLFFAAITDVWTAPGGVEVHQMASVTCEPSEDLRDVHHRMAVILSFADVPVWLNGTDDEIRPLMVPWPDGLLQVSKAKDIDWDGA